MRCYLEFTIIQVDCELTLSPIQTSWFRGSRQSKHAEIRVQRRVKEIFQQNRKKNKQEVLINLSSLIDSCSTHKQECIIYTGHAQGTQFQTNMGWCKLYFLTCTSVFEPQAAALHSMISSHTQMFLSVTGHVLSLCRLHTAKQTPVCSCSIFPP